MWLARHDDLTDPFALFAQLGHEMERAFGLQRDRDLLAVNVHEANDAFHLLAPLPGVRPEDLEVEVENGVLRIAGAWADTAQDGRRLVRERRTGGFERRLRLPDRVDPAGVNARYEDGLLYVTLAKREEAAARRIAVSVA